MNEHADFGMVKRDLGRRGPGVRFDEADVLDGSPPDARDCEQAVTRMEHDHRFLPKADGRIRVPPQVVAQYRRVN
jgi:hypothetical protein